MSKSPKSKIISELTSPYQLSYKKPEPITKFDWSLEDISKIQSKTKKKILENLKDYEFGLLYSACIQIKHIFLWQKDQFGKVEPLDKKNKKLYQTVNHTPTIIRPFLQSLWPHSKIKKNLKMK